MHPGYQAAEYRQQDIMGASQLRLVVMTYDLAINACEQKDFARATRAVSVLRDALNFDYEESAVGLFRLYQWCLDCLRREEYQTAAQILSELRQAWITADKRLSRIPGAPVYST
jgi:flagellin-specific chaperone FliS